jgi:hypothetical protein
MAAAKAWRGHLCPEDAAHGVVLFLGKDPTTNRDIYHCPHSGHMRRPRTHQLGERAATRHTFSLVEVESGQLAVA